MIYKPVKMGFGPHPSIKNGIILGLIDESEDYGTWIYDKNTAENPLTGEIWYRYRKGRYGNPKLYYPEEDTQWWGGLRGQ